MLGYYLGLEFYDSQDIKVLRIRVKQVIHIFNTKNHMITSQNQILSIFSKTAITTNG
jgi:hypothetical protein